MSHQLDLARVPKAGRTDLDFSGQAALVVGGTEGWGKAVASRLAALGAAVFINSRDDAKVRQAVGDIRASGAKAAGIGLSPASVESAERVVGEAVKEFGRLDILINSAGRKRFTLLPDITEETMRRTFEGQLYVPFCTARAAARVMTENGYGRIINMAGGASYRGYRGMSEHGATKGAIVAATYAWALDLKDAGITVNAVRGGVKSEGTRRQIEYLRQRRETGCATDEELGFFAPEVAAELVVWLASREAGHITGRYLGLDGKRLTIEQGPRSVSVFAEHAWTADSIGAALTSLDLGSGMPGSMLET